MVTNPTINNTKLKKIISYDVGSVLVIARKGISLMMINDNKDDKKDDSDHKWWYDDYQYTPNNIGTPITISFKFNVLLKFLLGKTIDFINQQIA